MFNELLEFFASRVRVQIERLRCLSDAEGDIAIVRPVMSHADEKQQLHGFSGESSESRGFHH